MKIYKNKKIWLAAPIVFAGILVGIITLARCPFGYCPIFESELGMVKIDFRNLNQYLREAQKGSIEAQNFVGHLYLEGAYDGNPNYEEAFFWLSLPSGQGKFRQNGETLEFVKSQLKPEQIEKVEERLGKWQPDTSPEASPENNDDYILQNFRELRKQQQ